MKRIEFAEARALQYEMLKEVDSFCRKNNITYYLAYGTLLGAVRHRGFIPWDDDIDIMFPQPDLEKFCATYKSEIYKVVSCENDPAHNLVFPRLYDTRTFGYEGRVKTWGIGIDLYGIYGLPTSPFKHRDYIYEFYKLWRNRRLLSGIRRRFAKVGMRTTLNSPLLHKSTVRALKLQKSYPFDKSYVCMLDTRPAMPFLKDILDNPIEIQFEDGVYFVPKGYNELLTMMYGDYMELPPLSQRHPYHGYDCFWK